VDEAYFEPTIKVELEWQYDLSQEAPINIFGNISFMGKLFGRLLPKDLETKVFNIAPTDYNRNHDHKTLKMDLTATLDNKIISYMNEARKSSAKGDVNLTLEFFTTTLSNNAMISYIEEYGLTDNTFPKDLKTAIGNSKFKNSQNTSVLLYVYPDQTGSYYQNRSNLNLISSSGLGPNDGYLSIKTEKKVLEWPIKSSDWVHDFLPKLGLGQYEIIEIPRVETAGGFGDILTMLDEAKDKLYKSLDIGASLASLRNSLKKFLEIVNSEGGFKKLFHDNKNISSLAEALQNKLFGAASRSEDSSAPHAGGAIVEGYEAESLIFMAYSLYKMVFERIKGNDTDSKD
jgi:hypothetical protein